MSFLSVPSSIVTVALALTTVIVLQPSPVTCRWENITTVKVTDGNSLHNVSYEINNGTEIDIVFGDSILTLPFQIVFRNLSEIRLTCSDCENKSVVCQNGTGLRFENIKGLHIENLNFKNCEGTGNDLAINIVGGISVFECMNVKIENLSISSSPGVGMLIHNCNGEVTILNSHFVKNGIHHLSPYGGTGLCIIFSRYIARNTTAEPERFSSHNKNSTYLIQDCTFQDNVAKDAELHSSSHTTHEDLRPGRGGGLCLYISDNSAENFIIIADSKFVNNEAHWGLGMYVRFQHSVFHNQVLVTNSCFSHNKCNAKDLSCGGGGIHVGFLQMSNSELQRNNDSHLTNNSIIFNNCTIMNNTAIIGGGMTIRSSMFTLLNFQQVNNNLSFINCTWRENKAQFGSALDIATYTLNTYHVGYLPKPVFTDCSFTLNKVVDNCTRNSAPVTCRAGQGTVLISGFALKVTKNMKVTGNVGSGIVLASSVILFELNTNITFQNNTGFKGGAILLTGVSALHVKSNATLYFLDNKSATQGGAISYDSISFHADTTSQECFIQYIKDESSHNQTKPTFVFLGNEAGSGENRLTGLTNGNTLYASTFNPCFRKCSQFPSNETDIEDLLNCLGINTQNETKTINDRTALSTCIGKLSINMTGALKVIPGRKVTVPIIALSDFGQPDVGIYHVSTNNFNITVDQTSTYISDNAIQLYGKPGSKGLVRLQKLICRSMRANIEVELTECPPGYVSAPIAERPNSSSIRCICGTSYNQSYRGILRCNENNQALAHHGFWIGYNGNPNEHNLVTAYCPQGFCWGYYSNGLRLHPLPSRADKIELDNTICGPKNRKGIVCGSCIENHSVFYHSKNYKCGSHELCHLGWLFYILSELLPTTLFFVIILTLDISFTSGTANGFIFFAQVIDSLATNANNFIVYSDMNGTIKYYTAVKFFYRAFNLDFFIIESMSFCLWKGANALDMIAFKYVTVVFAMLLVGGTVLLLNKAHFRVKFIKPRTLRSSVIHGISAFLVICYAQTTRISLRLIVPVHLEHLNNANQHIHGNNTYVFRGDMEYFSSEHVKYVLPALVSLCTIVLIPPLLLIIYPLCYKVLALCKLSENKHVNRMIQLLFLEKMKPLLDSFQSCYKDNCRFFAGLYFCYRTLALIMYAFAPSHTLFYGILQCGLLVILMLHCIAQPYKNKWHNFVDTLIFVNLSLINVMTIIAYSYSYNKTKSTEAVINRVGRIQILLISLPLDFMAIFMAYHATAIVWQRYRKKRMQTESENYDNYLDEFPARMLEKEDNPFENDYKLL